MSGQTDVATIVSGLVADTESTRKLSAFHLQSLLSDPSFADAFVQGGGLPPLKRMVIDEHGNTLAYALGSLTRLLDLERGWDAVGSDIISRAVELVTRRPVINVLRNALFLLVLVISHPEHPSDSSTPHPSDSSKSFGIKVLKPILQAYDDFLDCLVERLSSADHVLCGNALQLINALLRDAVVNGGEDEWPRYIDRLQELGVMTSVEALMRGDATTDLAGPLLDFQRLLKLVLRRWRDVKVDLEHPEHKVILERLQAASFTPVHVRPDGKKRNNADKATEGLPNGQPQDWRRLGFASQDPTEDFQETGYLGMMDLASYVNRNTDAFQKALLEQSIWPVERQCPIARLSLRTTAVLFQEFGVESIQSERDARSNAENAGAQVSEWKIQPQLLRWEQTHAATVNTFIRLWKAADATLFETPKIEDLLRLVVSKVVGGAPRKLTTDSFEQQMSSISLETARKWQLDDLDDVYDYAWGSHLRVARQRLHTEALKFMQEQRIRCLLKGNWFHYTSIPTVNMDQESLQSVIPRSTTSWRFAQLSPSRRHLHHVTHQRRLKSNPSVSDMPQRIDVATISSVVSNVAAAEQPAGSEDGGAKTVTKLTIFGNPNASNTEEESTLLELNTTSSDVASEWLDGLLMLLDQQPITADTNKLVDMIETWSLKVRMLNLQWEDVDWARAESGQQRAVPSREGLDTDYWYSMGEGG